MRQESLKEILKRKKAMIDSIMYELMQQIRPQSALGEPRVLRMLGPCAA
jgi:hypothetical protein